MVRPSCRPCTGARAAIAQCARPATRQTRALHQKVWAATETQTSQNQQSRPTRTQRPRRDSVSVSPRTFSTSPANAGIAGRISEIARGVVSRTIEPYSAFGVTRGIYQKCTKPAAYEISEETRRKDEVPTTEDGEEIGVSVGGGVWHDEFRLLPSFSTWSQVTMLHMYLIVTRLRCFEKEAHQLWQGMLSDHFFQEAEDKMDRVHHITSRGLRQRHLQDLFMAWRGVIVAYDEGLVKGDAVLAAAVWRNLFKGNPDVDLRHLAAVVAWMRRSLAQFDRMPDESLILHGGAGIFSWAPPTQDLAGGSVDEPATKELSLLMQQAAKKEGVITTKVEAEAKATA